MKRASFNKKRLNELEIHRRAWHTRWAKYGRHIAQPLSNITDPKERAREEAKLRAETITAEARLEELRHQYLNRPARKVPKGMEAEDLADLRSGIYDPNLSREREVGSADIPETELRARLLEDVPFYATHGHFSDEVSEGTTSSKSDFDKQEEKLAGLRPGSFRDTFSKLTPDEQAHFRARAAQYLDFEARLHKLDTAETISTGEMVTGFATEDDKMRGGHLLSEKTRRKLSKREKREMERIADRASKTQYRDLEPADLPYLTEQTAPNAKRTLNHLIEKPDKTISHVRLTERETKKNIERTVKQALGKTFDDPKKQADRDELIDAIKESTFGMAKQDRMQLLAHTAHEMEQNYVRAMLPTATAEDRRRFRETQKRYKGIKLGASPELVHVKHELEQAYVEANLPGATDRERNRFREVKRQHDQLKESDPFSDEYIKASARSKARKLISRLGVEAESEFESDRQVREIKTLMTTEEQAAYARGKSKTGLTPSQKEGLARNAHLSALRHGRKSPVVEDYIKEHGREPNSEELARVMGIKKSGNKEAGQIVEEMSKVEVKQAPAKWDDPRTLGRDSVEHTYRMWGHADSPLLQGWLKRSMTDEDRKRFLAGKGSGKTGPVQLIPPTLKTQWAFHAQQRRNRAKGLVSGSASWGLQDNKVTSINNRNADRVAFGMIPNSKYVYQLRNRSGGSSREDRAPLDIEVPGYDLRPIKEIAPGDRYSENDFSSEPLEIRQQNERFKYTRGDKEPINPHNRSLTPFIAETIYVPVVGAKGQTHTVPDPKGRKEKAYFETTVKHDGPREGSGWDASQASRISQERYNALPNDARDTGDITRAVQYVFLDPSDLKLKDKQINKASLALPEKEIKGRKIGDRSVFKKFKIGDRLLFANLPMDDTRRDKVLAPYFEARAQREQEERSIRAAALAPQLKQAFPPASRTDLEFGRLPELDKRVRGNVMTPEQAAELKEKLGFGPIRIQPELHIPHDERQPNELAGEELKQQIIKQGGFEHQTELEMLAAAAGASAFYKLQKSAKRGILHKSFEKSALAAEKTKLYQKNKERWSLPHVKTDIDRAYITPGDAFLLDMTEKAKHPITSTTASTLGGLDIETPYYRKILINPETRELRAIQKESNRLHDIVRAQDYALDHVNDTGVFGAIRRHRAQGYLRHNIVKNFNTLEDPKQGVTSTLGESTRFARMYKDNDFVRESHPANHSGETFHVTGRMKGAAGDLLKEIGELREHSYVRQGLGPLGQPGHSTHFSSRLMHGDLTHGEEAVIVGGAVAATALGAAYLYHRHKEKQKEEAERMAFYNKMLPPAFNVPVPTIQANAWYKTGDGPIMSEIPGAANRRIPVRFGLHLKKKHIAIRPMDRPRQLDTKYDPNLPLGVAGFRVGVRPRGGSLKKSLTTDLQHPLTRNFKKGTHEAVILGRRIPFTLEDKKKITLSSTNPNRLTNKDRDEIISASYGSADEEAVRRFYSYGRVDPIIDMMNDPEEIERIGRQKGKPELEKIAMQQMRKAQGPVSRQRKRDKAATGQTGRYY